MRESCTRPSFRTKLNVRTRSSPTFPSSSRTRSRPRSEPSATCNLAHELAFFAKSYDEIATRVESTSLPQTRPLRRSPVSSDLGLVVLAAYSRPYASGEGVRHAWQPRLARGRHLPLGARRAPRSTRCSELLQELAEFSGPRGEPTLTVSPGVTLGSRRRQCRGRRVLAPTLVVRM